MWSNEGEMVVKFLKNISDNPFKIKGKSLLKCFSIRGLCPLTPQRGAVPLTTSRRSTPLTPVCHGDSCFGM